MLGRRAKLRSLSTGRWNETGHITVGERSDDRAGIRWVLGIATVLWLALVAAGLIFGKPRFASGAAVGGALALVHFVLLGRMVKRLLAGHHKTSRKAVALAMVRYGGVALVLAIAILVVEVGSLGLLLGVSVITTAILVATATGKLHG